MEDGDKKYEKNDGEKAVLLRQYDDGKVYDLGVSRFLRKKCKKATFSSRH